MPPVPNSHSSHLCRARRPDSYTPIKSRRAIHLPLRQRRVSGRQQDNSGIRRHYRKSIPPRETLSSQQRNGTAYHALHSVQERHIHARGCHRRCHSRPTRQMVTPSPLGNPSRHTPVCHPQRDRRGCALIPQSPYTVNPCKYNIAQTSAAPRRENLPPEIISQNLRK